MSVDFNTLLSDEQRKEILAHSIGQFAAEGYRHSLNLQVGESNDDQALVETSQAAIDTISEAISVYQGELDAI